MRSKKYEQIKTKKNKKVSAPPKTHHEIHSRPATAANSRRRATKHAARGSPYSRASSIDPGFVEISLACIHTYVPALVLLCRFCIRFGALFSRQRSFCFLCCDMYLRFRGCPVVLGIERYVSAWYHKTRRALYCCCCAAFVPVLVLYFLASASSAFSTVICISGFCPVTLDIELHVSA